jgi:formylglycine-generating enzyme required for sulfatase activity
MSASQSGARSETPETPSAGIGVRYFGRRARVAATIGILAALCCLVLAGRTFWPFGDDTTNPTATRQPRLSKAPFARRAADRAKLEWSRSLGIDVEIENSIGMKLTLIPPGEFLMGSPETETSRLANEDQHKVRITQTFYLGVREVTQAEYQEVMEKNPSFFSVTGGGKERIRGRTTDQFPVERVSWDEAQAFCEKLTELQAEQTIQPAGWVYRLPTEAEWEYACRAGATGQFCFGDSDSRLADFAWYGESFLNGTSHPTGKRKPNAFGLHDMHGNVWEWCGDWYAEYDDAPESVEDPRGPSQASKRVNRGGSWCNLALSCRSATRSRDSPSFRSEHLGFRVARVPPSD